MRAARVGHAKTGNTSCSLPPQACAVQAPLTAPHTFLQVLLCPAMNTLMWTHPATSAALTVLKGWGYTVIDPVSKTLGALALPRSLFCPCSSSPHSLLIFTIFFASFCRT